MTAQVTARVRFVMIRPEGKGEGCAPNRFGPVEQQVGEEWQRLGQRGKFNGLVVIAEAQRPK